MGGLGEKMVVFYRKERKVRKEFLLFYSFCEGIG